MSQLSWRAVMDDGSTISYEQEITVDGAVKRASIDDVDRSKLSNLLTVNAEGIVVHALGFSSEERKNKLAVWRLVRKLNPNVEAPVTMGVLSGYNDKKEGLRLDFVDSEDEKTYSGEGYECQLHPREVFTKTEAKKIRDEQESQNEAAEADNELLRNPKYELTEEDGNII